MPNATRHRTASLPVTTLIALWCRCGELLQRVIDGARPRQDGPSLCHEPVPGNLIPVRIPPYYPARPGCHDAYGRPRTGVRR